MRGAFLLVLAIGLAPVEQGIGAEFPAAQGSRLVMAPPQAVAGVARLTIQSVRFEAEAGAAIFQHVSWCGVVLQTKGGARQPLITIGQGRTEVLHCRRLREVGGLPARSGAARIGLVYETSSPNAIGRTLVILRRDREGGDWRSEDALAQRLEDRAQPLTLGRVRAQRARLPG